MAALSGLAAAPSAHALLRFNDGRDQIYVTAATGATYDSNIFSSGVNPQADMLVTASAGIEYSRKAGMIGVTGRLSWELGQFADFASEDFLNPSASAEFTKTTGRTTGGLQLNVRRESKPDATVGLRTDAWNYGVNLNYRYPVIDRYSIAGSLGASRVDYQDDGPLFSDLDSYTASTDLFYSWRSDRDLLAGYRIRTGTAQAGSTNTAHSVYVGVTGRIIRKLSGSLRTGYTMSFTSYPGNIPDDSQGGTFVSMSTTWPVSPKINVTAAASRDFNTTSTNFQTISTTADVTAQLSHTVKLSSYVTAGWGTTEYVNGYGSGQTTVSPGFNGLDREDSYYTLGYGINYALNGHITLGASYTYYQNLSRLASSDFTRHSVGFTVSTRW